MSATRTIAKLRAEVAEWKQEATVQRIRAILAEEREHTLRILCRYPSVP